MNKSVAHYQSTYRTSRKAVLRSVWDTCCSRAAVTDANQLLRKPVKDGTLRTWCSKWRQQRDVWASP